MHRTRRGTWRVCRDAACERPFHLDMGVEAANQLPFDLLLPLLNSIDPGRVTATSDGVMIWTDESGRLHRDYDLPASISAESMVWWWHGATHRAGDKPAVVGAEVREWYQRNEVHRDGDKPAIIRADGTREWLRRGLWHREHGRPAIVSPQSQQWWVDGECHCVTGPAIIEEEGGVEWWLHGLQVTESELKLGRSWTDADTARIWAQNRDQAATFR